MHAHQSHTYVQARLMAQKKKKLQNQTNLKMMMLLVLLVVLTIVGCGVYAYVESRRVLKDMVVQGLQLQKDQPGGKRETERRVMLLIWFEKDRRECTSLLLEQVTKAILKKCGTHTTLTWYIKDRQAAAESAWSPNLSPISAPIDAQVTIGGLFHFRHEQEVQSLGKAIVKLVEKESDAFTVHGYMVDQSLYTDYGEYAGPATAGWDPSLKRDWSDGTRAPKPYAVNHTLFPKKAGLTKEEFQKKWFETQSPMSEIMQPRAKYVRNFVDIALTSNAPRYSASVIEVWPSKKHVDNPFLFFNADNPWQLVVNIFVMMTSVLRIMDLSKITGSSVGEYIVGDK